MKTRPFILTSSLSLLTIIIPLALYARSTRTPAPPPVFTSTDTILAAIESRRLNPGPTELAELAYASHAHPSTLTTVCGALAYHYRTNPIPTPLKSDPNLHSIILDALDTGDDDTCALGIALAYHAGLSEPTVKIHTVRFGPSTLTQDAIASWYHHIRVPNRE